MHNCCGCKVSPRSYLSKVLYDKIGMRKAKRNNKVSGENFRIPLFDEADKLLEINYNVSQLKAMARHYKQKVSGNKQELVFRIHNFLKYSKYATVLQRYYRGHLRRRYNGLQGPAIFNRACTNVTDFLSLEPLSAIPYQQFISYTDKDRFIYGFDVKSLYNLTKRTKGATNPYNRSRVPAELLADLRELLRLAQVLGHRTTTQIKDPAAELSDKKCMELKAVSLFHQIDSYGHVTNSSWFLALGRAGVVKFLRELADIWAYRAQLTPAVKRQICPPAGDPFRDMDMQRLATMSRLSMQNAALRIAGALVGRGEDRNSCALGAFYVLAALTLVNTEAASALPWLYESVVYNAPANG